MIENNFVIDGVVHAFDFSNDNRVESYPTEKFRNVQNFWHQVIHASLESPEPNYLLNFEEFTTRWNVEDLAHALFVESDVDMVVSHSVQISAVLQNGPSPWNAHVELKRLAPDRVLLYGEVDTLLKTEMHYLATWKNESVRERLALSFIPQMACLTLSQTRWSPCCMTIQRMHTRSLKRLVNLG